MNRRYLYRTVFGTDEDRRGRYDVWDSISEFAPPSSDTRYEE